MELFLPPSSQRITRRAQIFFNRKAREGAQSLHSRRGSCLQETQASTSLPQSSQRIKWRAQIFNRKAREGPQRLLFHHGGHRGSHGHREFLS